MTRNNIPTWLNEGLAEVEGQKEFSHPAPLLSRAVKEGRLIPLATLSGSFASMAGSEAGLAYQQSYSLVSFMVSRYGWHAVQEILKRLGERATIDVAVAQGLADWSLDLGGVIKEWRQTLPAADESR